MSNFYHWPDRTIGKRESRLIREQNNKPANEHAELIAALDLATATVELNTRNGAKSQPNWKLDANGNIDYEYVATICRTLLKKVSQ